MVAKKDQASKEKSAKGDEVTATTIFTDDPNKTWAYSGSYTGQWIYMNQDQLEGLAYINYTSLRPKPYDDGTLFDIVKVRKLTFDATILAWKADSGAPKRTLTNVSGPNLGPNPIARALESALAAQPAHSNISPDRRFRMRVQASRKLSEAYHLAEEICSSCVVPGNFSPGNVGGLVLKRAPDDVDASYVSFFNNRASKGNKGSQGFCMQTLDSILDQRPDDVAVLRTRAELKSISVGFDEALKDLDSALAALPESAGGLRKTIGCEVEVQRLLSSPQRQRNRDAVLPLAKNQPTGMQSRIFFQRAIIHFNAACCRILTLVSLRRVPGLAIDSKEDFYLVQPTSADDSQALTDEQRTEDLQAIKTLAKRALKDVLSFLSTIEYSPNYPLSAARDVSVRIEANKKGVNYPRPSPLIGDATSHTIYKVSKLFSASPPQDLPPYPAVKSETGDEYKQPRPDRNSVEYVTYHPVLSEALHVLLQCHCLLQTSVKEIQRHAYMTARLIRILEREPIFQEGRSTAHDDWWEIMNLTGRKLGIGYSWDVLTVPTPLDVMGSSPEQTEYFKTEVLHSDHVRAAMAAAKITGSDQTHCGGKTGLQVYNLAERQSRYQATVEDAEDEDEDENNGSRSVTSSGGGGSGSVASPVQAGQSPLITVRIDEGRCMAKVITSDNTLAPSNNRDIGFSKVLRADTDYLLASPHTLCKRLEHIQVSSYIVMRRALAVAYWVAAELVVPAPSKKKRRGKNAVVRRSKWQGALDEEPSLTREMDNSE